MQKLSNVDFQQSIPFRFENIAKEVPDHVALQSGTKELHYNELNAGANRLAHLLLDRIGDQPEPVILLLEDPIQNVTAQLGALKSRKACVPIDIMFPIARQNDIFTASGSRLILTEKKYLSRAQEIASADHVLCVEEAGGMHSTENLNLFIEPATLAYILYTSGSTGHPKGVMQSHRSLLHHTMTYSEALRVVSSDRLTTPTSFASTVTLWALLASLTNGATLVFTSFESPATFLDSLIRSKINVVHLLVALLRQFMQSLDAPVQSNDLRMVFTGGESLRKEDVDRFTEIFPRHCVLGYNYGSTEAGLVSYRHFHSESGNQLQQHTSDRPFAIGPAVDDTTVLFLDKDGIEVAEGQEGQIVIRSHYIADGYWKRPDLTEKHFPAELTNDQGRVYLTGDLGRWSVDGNLICLGRNDSQVKIRGYRVHLEEIENALGAIPGMIAAAVRAIDRGQGKMDLIAYIHPAESCTMTVRELRQTLASLLPHYMIPATFVHVERFPLTSSGKLDRRALPDPGLTRPDLNVPFESARTDTEKALCDFFCEAMSIDAIGIRDHLMDLGADSLTIFRVIGQIQKLFHVDIPASAFLDHPYIELLAQAVDKLKQSTESM